MTYEKDNGPLDLTGLTMREGARIAIGSNNGIRVGKIEAIKPSEKTDWDGQVYGYDYSITVKLELPTQRRQTFQHDLMGEEKFWVISS